MTEDDSTQHPPHTCASTKLWSQASNIDIVSLHSLRECSSKPCSQCLCCIQVLSLIFDQQGLPQDLAFSKQKGQSNQSSQLWTVTPKEYGEHISGIEILLSSDQSLLSYPFSGRSPLTVGQQIPERTTKASQAGQDLSRRGS